MRNRTFSARVQEGAAAALLFALAGCFALVAAWEARLPQPQPAAATWRFVDYAAGSPPAPPASFRRSEKRGVITASYGFLAPGNRPLQVDMTLPAADYRRYRDRFGYRQEELDALYREQERRLQQAYREAVEGRQPQAEVDAVYARIKEDYHARTRALILERGFRFVDERTLTADIPRIVRDNTAALEPLARALRAAAATESPTDADIVAIALPFAQTALAYAALPAEREGRLTAGFSPPLEVLLEGRGDCDSKSALLAALLLNWDRMRLIGIGIPGHYLLGVLRVPARGDVFYEYDGLTYVLMEPAGPSWLPPGMVADTTLARLDAGRVMVEPLTGN